MRCRTCDEEKPASAFHWKEKGKRRNTMCKECEKQYHRDHYQRNKAKVSKQVRARNKAVNRENHLKAIAYLSEHPCVDCGETHIATLDFDHVRGEKSFNIAKSLNQSYSWDRIMSEIAKCDVRCSNCHRKRTAKEHGWYSYMAQ